MDDEMKTAVDRFKILIAMTMLGLPKEMDQCGAECLEKAREYARNGEFEFAQHSMVFYKLLVNEKIDAIIMELDGMEKTLQMLNQK